MSRLVVGVPCYNEAQYIEQCLHSISKNDLSGVQVFISDNSTDGSTEVIQKFLASLPVVKRKSFKLYTWGSPVAANKNWAKSFRETDSEYFMWVGAHDMITDNFFQTCLETFVSFPDASIVSGKPLALSQDSKRVAEVKVAYDFSSENPLERYLKSIAELENCTVVYSIFKKRFLREFDFPNIGSADHILLSNILWHGKLVYCEKAGYLRRMFDAEDREKKAEKGYYLNDENRLFWYCEYMRNFIRCADGQYPDEIYPFIKNLVFEKLCARFGLPNTLSTARNILAEASGL